MCPCKTGRGIEKVSYSWALKGKQNYIEKQNGGHKTIIANLAPIIKSVYLKATF